MQHVLSVYSIPGKCVCVCVYLQAAAVQQAAEKEVDPAEAGPASTAQQEPAEATPQQVTCLPSLQDTLV